MRGRALACRAIACVAAAVCAPSASAQQQHRYEREWPGMEYLHAAGDNPVERLRDAESGRALDAVFRGGRVDVRPLLEVLGLSTTSQMLVFSKTSLQEEYIAPETPRAIWFGDDVYVAWARGSGSVELSALDPELGPVFYMLRPGEGGVELRRENDTCLQCHDTYSLTGGGVPRYLTGSGPTFPSGDLASHGNWLLVTDDMPIARRWGGWYVTGRRGPERHLGNRLTPRGGSVPAGGGVLGSVAERIDAAPYPTPYSDIVALLVFEHQHHVQNRIARLRWETVGRAEMDDPETRQARMGQLVDELVEALVMEGAAPLSGPVEGSAGFKEHFEALGPFDAEGRTLRALDLESRVFRYPLSYVIEGQAFAALDRPVREAVWSGVVTRLRSTDPGALPEGSAPLAETALNILAATDAEFARWFSARR